MKKFEVDIAIIGGGAAGLSAAAKCAGKGRKIIIIERSASVGGVLNQCIHSGFGLHYFREELTGPEYAARLQDRLRTAEVEIMTESSVVKITKGTTGHCLSVYSAADGIMRIEAAAVILAMGCRERCRGNIGIPGVRSAGVFNAGFAQQLINTEGYLPGTRVVIVGSGDIGLIMARRLTWSGIKVECVVEIMPYPAGLSRNIAQCLEDFNIPLYLSHTVTEICGNGRVTGVKTAPLVDGKPDLSREKYIECDTVLFSVGLVPENELAREYGIEIDPVTGGAVVNDCMMTNKEGIFACGNVLHVHDLADFVSQEAEMAAASAVACCEGNLPAESRGYVIAGEGVRYAIPQRFTPGREIHFFIRSAFVADSTVLAVKDGMGNEIYSKHLRYVKPAEMISFEIPAAAAETLTITLEKN